MDTQTLLNCEVNGWNNHIYITILMNSDRQRNNFVYRYRIENIKTSHYKYYLFYTPVTPLYARDSQTTCGLAKDRAVSIRIPTST